MFYAYLLELNQINLFLCFTINGINPWSQITPMFARVYITQMVAELIHSWAQIGQKVQHQAAGIYQSHDHFKNGLVITLLWKKKHKSRPSQAMLLLVSR